MVRKMFFIVVAGLMLVAATAQAGQHTLLQSGEFHSGGFGGPSVMWTTFGGEDAMMVGGTGAWVVNRTIYLGGGGYGLVTDHDGPAIPDYLGTPRLQMGYGGGMIGIILRNDDLFHLTGDVMVGGGAVSNMMRNTDQSYEDWRAYDTDSFWFVQPMVHLELNVTNWMRVAASVGYRSVRDFNSFGMNADDISGKMAGVTFRFGSW